VAGLTRDATVFPDSIAARPTTCATETLDYCSRFHRPCDNPRYPPNALTELLTAASRTVIARLADYLSRGRRSRSPMRDKVS